MDYLCMENSPGVSYFPYKRGAFRKARHSVLLSPAQLNILAPSPNIEGSISFQCRARVRNSTDFAWGAAGAANSYNIIVTQVFGNHTMHISEKSATLRRKAYGPEVGQSLRLGRNSGAGAYRTRV